MADGGRVRVHQRRQLGSGQVGEVEAAGLALGQPGPQCAEQPSAGGDDREDAYGEGGEREAGAQMNAGVEERLDAWRWRMTPPVRTVRAATSGPILVSACLRRGRWS
ncbi:MAG: hypothetical protein M3P93_00025 [Actinomycetota bacterium]|nr:hypothetical protein [Actinomycetota bacterium]